MVAAGQQGTADRLDRNAFRALVLNPFDGRHHRSRPDRDAPDHLVLNHQARDGRLCVARLNDEHPQKQGKQIPNSPNSINVPPSHPGFAARA